MSAGSSGTVRWGIMSTAGSAQKHVVPALHQVGNCEPLAVASRSLERAETMAQEMDIPRAYGSYQELLEDPDVDAVYVPLPTGLHAEWALRCAEAGKPTLVEKPIATNAEEAREIADAFAERGVPLAEALMYVFHPRMQQIKEMVDDGEVGEVRVIQSVFCAQPESEENFRYQKELGGGALRDVGCYCVSLTRQIAGQEPSQVSATAHIRNGCGVEDWLAGTLTFPSGVVGSFCCSLATEFGMHFDIYGSEGRIFVPGGVVPNIDAEAPIHHYVEYEKEEIVLPAANQWALMVEDFADSLLNDRPPLPPVEESIRNMEVLDGLLEAAGL